MYISEYHPLEAYEDSRLEGSCDLVANHWCAAIAKTGAKTACV
jgi:hypothetical protein